MPMLPPHIEFFSVFGHITCLCSTCMPTLLPQVDCFSIFLRLETSILLPRSPLLFFVAANAVLCCCQFIVTMMQQRKSNNCYLPAYVSASSSLATGSYLYSGTWYQVLIMWVFLSSHLGGGTCTGMPIGLQYD